MTLIDVSRTADTDGAPDFRHDVGFYSSDAEFRDLIVPFAEAGLDNGEAVIFGYDPRQVSLLRSWLPESDAITYVADTSPYASPALALGGWQRLVQAKLAEGYPYVRIAGNVPHPGYGIPYSGWDRYELAVDPAWQGKPAWARCLYDTRVAPVDVVDRARRLHQYVTEPASAGAPVLQENPAFREIRSLHECLPPPRDALEEREPVVELLDPTPASARNVVAEIATAFIGDDLAADLCLATSEAVTNALTHGAPPVRLRVWADADGKVAVHVRDQGPGPADPLVGLVHAPPTTGASGRGLWLVHRLGLGTWLGASDDGFAVRLFAAKPAAEAEPIAS